MNQKPKRAAAPQPGAADDVQLAPITAMMSSRLMVLANLLKRGAILRYKRLAGLSSVEFGLVASLGRRPPMTRSWQARCNAISACWNSWTRLMLRYCGCISTV